MTDNQPSTQLNLQKEIVREWKSPSSAEKAPLTQDTNNIVVALPGIETGHVRNLQSTFGNITLSSGRLAFCPNSDVTKQLEQLVSQGKEPTERFLCSFGENLAKTLGSIGVFVQAAQIAVVAVSLIKSLIDLFQKQKSKEPEDLTDKNVISQSMKIENEIKQKQRESLLEN